MFRTLRVIDEAHRRALGIDLGISLPRSRAVAFLAQPIDMRVLPGAIRSDNGSELTSQVRTDKCERQGIKFRSIQPGKPDQNAYIERFNRTCRVAVLSA